MKQTPMDGILGLFLYCCKWKWQAVAGGAVTGLTLSNEYYDISIQILGKIWGLTRHNRSAL
jgi:hypothetical protein